jgi:chromate reductase
MPPQCNEEFMSDTIKVLGLVGSFRKAGYNGMALRAAIELTPPGMLIETHDYRDIPFYHGDLEDESGIPAPVKALGEKIRAADALLIVTPEYNTSLPGLLKNALDWVSREPQGSFAAKPVAVMGASPGSFGTVRAQQHLREVLRNVGAQTMQRPQVTITLAEQRFSADGRLTDEATRQHIGKLLVALGEWTMLLRK